MLLYTALDQIDSRVWLRKLAAFLPGQRCFPEGQLEGRRLKVSMPLGR
jgi:hypothetical protein